MRYIHIMLFSVICFATTHTEKSFAQNKTTQTTITVPVMPIDDESKVVTYQGTVEVAGTQKELYKKALTWFNSYFKNPAEKLRGADSINGSIDGYIRFKIYNPENKDGLKTEAGMVQYSLLLNFKDGKFRYTITNINWKQPSYYAIEKWMDKKDQYYKSEFDYYLVQTNDEAQKVINDLSTYMKKIQVKKEDW